MLQLFRSADLHEEKVRLMRSLGAVKDEKLIQKVLDFSMTVSSEILIEKSQHVISI